MLKFVQAPVRAIINARATKNLLFHSYAINRKAQVEIAVPTNKHPILLKSVTIIMPIIKFNCIPAVSFNILNF